MPTRTKAASKRPNDRGGRPPRADWKERFLETLEKTQLPSEAIKASGASRAYIYKYRKKDPEFDAKWTEIIERGTEILEQIAVRRAAEGSDTLMIFLLKARRPEVYRENVQIQHDHNISGRVQLELPNGAQPIDIEASNRREAARLLMAGTKEEGDEDVIDIDPANVVEDEEAT